MLYELLIDYSGGSIRLNSTEEIASTNSGIQANFYHLETEGSNREFNPEEKLFDGLTTGYASAGSNAYVVNGANKFYFYIKLDNPISAPTGGTYWTLFSGASFDNLNIYGTNTDPSTLVSDW